MKLLSPNRNEEIGRGEHAPSRAVFRALAEHRGAAGTGNHLDSLLRPSPTGEGAGRNTRGRVCSPNRTGVRRAFTLIEIMVVVGIMAVILTISIPFFARQMHKDSMRQAIADVTELCREARNRAVLDGRIMELRIQPAAKTFSVASGTAATATTGGNSVNAPAGDPGGTSTLTRKLSDHIIIEFIGVNLEPDLHLTEQCGAFFYPNGTSDELVIVLRSDQGEVRQITTDVVTGIADVEAKR